MKEIEILKRLISIENNLACNPTNPAYYDDNGAGLRVNVGGQEAEEIIEMIGEWSANKRRMERETLENEKIELKKKLI